MEYKGKYSIFNTDNIKTYPIFLRRNKVKINSFVKLDVISQTQYEISSSVREKIKEVAHALPEGKFGMAYELAYINETLRLGNIMKLGYGESPLGLD